MQEKSILSQLFPKPTGRNGYEDLVRAGELLKTSALWADAQQQNTLSSRRRALADPPVRQARALIETSALKPLESPVRELTASTTFPEYTGLRDLARLLSAEMHVLFSEGRAAAALVSFAQGLRLGSAPKAQVLIGGLVGAAIDSVLLTRVKTHLEQLTPRDCDRVQAILREHQEQDQGSASKAIAMEQRFVESILPTLETSDPAIFRELFTDSEDPTLNQLQRQFSALQNNPTERKRVLGAFLQGAQQHQARAQAYLLAPHILPPEPKLPAGTLEAALLDTITPAYPRAVENLVKNRIQCQLLYCYAAVRKYKWEWEKLPDRLEPLRLAEWALDPFTRQPFRYERTENGYELYSAGPADEDGKRTPIQLPWRKN
ncbi:hypothetical protein [Armatimonas rosea]|uniref:Uncharacterized protein n=1 Tax=Armatimonas rosea TaxID=685828 RepID=A0A7W9W886_ARMRO|nr:hypothetical protein [Armatimonas rosea]MBB6051885.1 hypothetical protein [Armatimonas rosea]